LSFKQFVVFSLDKEEYGIEISCAQEIIRIPEQITRIPKMPSYVEGMFNLRGKVILVVDLKKRFGFEHTEKGIDSRLLILDLEGMQVGVVVDDVSEVLRISEESVESLSSELATMGSNSIKGICKANERLILLLDTSKMKNEVFDDNKYEMEGVL